MAHRHSDRLSELLPHRSKRDEDHGGKLLQLLPGDGRTICNQSVREALSRAAERPISEEQYEAIKETALTLGLGASCA